jgi:hypothetical protein
VSLLPVCAVLLGCSNPSSKPTEHSSVSGPVSQYGPITVLGRAGKPTDVQAAGIQVLGKELAFSVDGHQVVITGTDWNTIVGTSKVPSPVGLILDPIYQVSSTTLNRFQYLADWISHYPVSKFETVGLDVGKLDGRLATTVGLYNPSSQVVEISQLQLKILWQPPVTTEAAQTFFQVPATVSGCIIPARTVYIGRFTFARYTPPPKSVAQVSVASTTSVRNCPNQICAKALPIISCTP